VKNKRPFPNLQSRQKPKFVDELAKLAESARIQSLKREAEKLAQSARIQSLKQEAEKLDQSPRIQSLKQGLNKLAKVKRAERERELEQEIERERRERAKQRLPKRGGRPETLTAEMEQDACAELERWIREHNRRPKQLEAYIYMRDWLAEEPRKVDVSETTVRQRIVSPTSLMMGLAS
jgi:hypothetical protein